MRIELHRKLEKASKRNDLPKVIVYNRIDGPGSSLDLREFQQAFWTLPNIPDDLQKDPTMDWTRTLPRTVGITIDTGTMIEAHPLEAGSIGVKSLEYSINIIVKPGTILPIEENWLLKVIDLFNLSGVKFILHNIIAGTQSAGLGGSATAITGVCILANELAGRPFGPIQLIALASRIEQDLGVSITGTQEQSNVIYGGVTDYVWFPWGIPGKPRTGYGESIRTELISPNDYGELKKRIAVYHTGITRPSKDVNKVWRKKLLTAAGYRLHKKKLNIAYMFREGLRLRKWKQLLEAVKAYRKIRFELCSDYTKGADEIIGRAEAQSCEAFPLGAGGGGGVCIFSSDPNSLDEFRKDIGSTHSEIPFEIKPEGHELFNLPIVNN